MKNLRSGQNNIAGNHHKPGAGEWWFSFLVKVLNFFAWDVLNIMRKVEYEKLNRNRIDFENGETARTHYRLLSYDEEKDLSYISLKLDTGRTHQIRVHMGYIGHPLPGDFLYNPDYRYISRQPLHSYGLEFIHPLTKTPLSFTAPLPKDMAALVKE